jgi:hypothetical protein
MSHPINHRVSKWQLPTANDMVEARHWAADFACKNCVIRNSGREKTFK